jgi:hypothetical protein
MKTIVKYALRHKKSGELLKYFTTSNSNKMTTELTEHGDKIWSVDTKLNAEFVRNFSTKWYNAQYETPINKFKPKDLEVVELTTTIEAKPIDIKLPTVKEYIELKYKKREPLHYEYLLEQLKQGYTIEYSLWELLELYNK